MPSAPLSKCGDNLNSVHHMKMLIDEADHILCYCERCKQRFYVKPKDKRRYAKLFKKDILQPGSNLYYKERPNLMNVI